MQTKVLFIINPNSGTKRRKNIEELAKTYLPDSDFLCTFIYTERRGHASEICKDAILNFDIIVAVGGDGTIHEVAQHVIHSNAALAIIPMGSGNGLARFLHIPLLQKKAVQLIAKKQIHRIDTILCNNEYFINVAGFGFDARIGDVFDKTPKRGGVKYIKLVGKELFNYKPQTLTFFAEDSQFTKTFFIASIANSSQWGMNAHIAPLADIRDGFFDVVFIKKFPIRAALTLVWKLFSKQIHTSKYVETFKAHSLTVNNNSSCVLHLDGEPRTIEGDIAFTIHKHSLAIIMG
ncbi:MAG TPA: YegS/Rv2252/BmrU family lipid kinase [Bacteroidales bacterium]|nr:YegS/Rv2252/BmrU family lipid kinase [Bacteroidales bacterium]